MNLNIIDHSFHYEMEKLTQIFFPNEKVTVNHDIVEDGSFITTKRINGEKSDIIYVKVCIDGKTEEATSEVDKTTDIEEIAERKMAQMIFSILSEMLSYIPPWGILTGVRPSKLMCKLVKEMGEDAAVDYFRNELKVSEEKTKLALDVAKKEEPIMDKSELRSFSLYISIPFCPTRCSYCSFVSHSNDQAKKLIPMYVDKLCEEIRETGKIVKDTGLKLESVYYGGGTPTTLSAEQYEKVSKTIKESFDLSTVEEYTVEAGRPDTVTDEKLDALKKSGVTRISINPQTFNDSVLEKIGRKHTSKETENAMLMAKRKGFDNINMDLIAGLPGDTLESFENTIDKTISFDPESITVHTLALKRSSTIVTNELETNDADLCKLMLDVAKDKLTKNGYKPYYMYRQSKCLGNLENVGWAKDGYECLYNIYMMEECHTVIALGAGAVTKLKDPYGEKIERVYNYKYPYEYINNFDEIIRRKEKIGEFYNEILKR